MDNSKEQKITSFSQVRSNNDIQTDKEDGGDWDELRKNKPSKVREVVGMVVRVFMISFTFLTFLVLLVFTFFLGYTIGYNEGQLNTQGYYGKLANQWLQAVKQAEPITKIVEVPVEVPAQDVETTYARNVDWGGPELWVAVNKRRVELGVNALDNRTDLCTIASIRLNELLELGKLDGHEGFSNMSEERPDLKHIFENYSTVAEFLAAGGSTAQETVEMWENTMGHSQLLTGGEYVWGCIYAQNSFAVAITAF